MFGNLISFGAKRDFRFKLLVLSVSSFYLSMFFVNFWHNTEGYTKSQYLNEKSIVSGASQSSIIPKKLLIYYGYPSSINASGADASKAVQHFAKYDYVVLGESLEDLSHNDHNRTVEIVSHQLTDNVKFFGYVDSRLSLNASWDNIDQWIATGVDGIFFDVFAYDYGITRSQQNALVDYAHNRGTLVFVNGWDPDDVFGNAINSQYNPNGAATSLGSRDFYLSESYQITLGNYQPESQWRAKQNKLDAYRDRLGFEVLAVTTGSSSFQYDQNKFFYAWYSALIDGYEAVGWGEASFSSSAQPYRARPNFSLDNTFTSALINQSPIFKRLTSLGEVWVNTATHQYGFN